LASFVVYISLVVAIFVSFWSSLIEATYLTVRPISLNAAARSGTRGASQALEIIREKTKLVSTTTFLDTAMNVVLATSIGLIFSEIFGPLGWVYSAVLGSFMIMTFLFLLPKAIGIENSVMMATWLGPTSLALVKVLSPVAVPMTKFARSLSLQVVGKPSYRADEIVDEFEEMVGLLEKGGHIDPDAGRIIRSALASSKKNASDTLTPLEEIVSVTTTSTLYEALMLMGRSNHPRLPVYDEERKEYLGAVTFRSLSRAMAEGKFGERVSDYVAQAARVESDESVAVIIDRMQKGSTTVAFVYDDGKMIGMVTLTDILEQILGVKI